MRFFLPLAAVLLFAVFVARADTPQAVGDDQKIVDKAVEYFKAQQQPDGSWQKSGRQPPAVTALVLRVLAQDPKEGPQCYAAKKAVAYLQSMQQPDGGIYKDMLANYNTAICISALTSLNDPALKPSIDKAVEFLKGGQLTENSTLRNGEKIDANHPNFGGWDYGGGRGGPDLSNTAVALDALKDAGLKSDDPAYQRALKFVSRLQNNSETNPAAWAGNDGGFIYNPGRNGEGVSSAGEYTSPDGKRMVRSYGGMTYAGLKSMIYAGLSKDDPRVKAAYAWVGANWTLDQNPGMAGAGAENARAGIFYYYNTLGRALSVYGEPSIQDKDGAPHDWRVELITKLASVQNSDGSFVGDNKWMENDPLISTPLAALAVQDAMKDLSGSGNRSK